MRCSTYRSCVLRGFIGSFGVAKNPNIFQYHVRRIHSGFPPVKPSPFYESLSSIGGRNQKVNSGSKYLEPASPHNGSPRSQQPARGLFLDRRGMRGTGVTIPKSEDAEMTGGSTFGMQLERHRENQPVHRSKPESHHSSQHWPGGDDIKHPQQRRRPTTNFSLGLSPEEHETESWKTHKEALKEKFGPGGWAPRKRLSPDTLEGIRQLHAQYPDKYTTPVLADQFKISPEAIRRILKSKWRPDEQEEEHRRERWIKRGEGIWTELAEKGIKPPKKWRKKGIRRTKEQGEARDWQAEARLQSSTIAGREREKSDIDDSAPRALDRSSEPQVPLADRIL